MSLPKELLERRDAASEKAAHQSQYTNPIGEPTYHHAYTAMREGFKEGFDACFSILLERGAGEFPYEEWVKWVKETSQGGVIPARASAEWGFNIRNCEVAAWKAKAEGLEQLLEHEKKVSDLGVENEERLEAQLAERDKEIAMLKRAVKLGDHYLRKYEEQKTQLAEKTAALEKLIKSIEADCEICDSDGAKLGAGWAFVEDIALARKVLSQDQKGGGE